MLVVDKVSKAICSKRILNNVSINIRTNSIYSLMGSNGAGKTSLIRIINALYSMDEGKILIDGIDPFLNKEKIHLIIGLSTEESKMYPDLTMEENLEYYAQFYDCENTNMISLCEALYIREFFRKKYRTLSSGVKKKADLIRSLLHNPKLVIWDEPFANMDPEGKKALIQVINHWNKDKGTTFFISTHDIHACQTFSTDAAFLFDGKIVEEGSVDGMLSRYKCNNLEQVYFIAKERKDENL